MDEMRRIGILSVATGYGLSFVAACLSACLMGPAAVDHSCCPTTQTDRAIRAVGSDCCAVTPGVSHAAPFVSAAATASATDTPVLIAERAYASSFSPAVSVTPSPPHILRI